MDSLNKVEATCGYSAKYGTWIPYHAIILHSIHVTGGNEAIMSLFSLHV